MPAIAFTQWITQPILQDCTPKTMKSYPATSILKQEHTPQLWWIHIVKVHNEPNHMHSILRLSHRFEYHNPIGPQSQNATHIAMTHSMTELKIHQAMLLLKCNILKDLVMIFI